MENGKMNGNNGIIFDFFIFVILLLESIFKTRDFHWILLLTLLVGEFIFKNFWQFLNYSNKLLIFIGILCFRVIVWFYIVNIGSADQKCLTFFH